MNHSLQLKELAGAMSILYIEDEKSIREDMEKLLKKFFASVDSGTNGQEGLDLYGQKNYDIVLTDILMPVMQGYTMIEQIRETQPSQVIIIMTAFDYKDFLIPKYKNGANFFLPKPSNSDDIVSTLITACELCARQ
jgi:YesN/AraC family two-component response regulator